MAVLAKLAFPGTILEVLGTVQDGSRNCPLVSYGSLMRIPFFIILDSVVSEHPMSDHVPTVPAPSVLPDDGGSVRVTRAKALRTSTSKRVVLFLGGEAIFTF